MPQPSDPSLSLGEAPPAPSGDRPAPTGEALIAGRYRPLRLLGTGGMGEVYLAVHEGPQGFRRVVALKRMRPTGIQDLVQHFLDEARLVAKLAHRNVIQIYELGEGPQGFFVAMEYVRGACIERLIERLVTLHQSLPPSLALDIAAQVADGLDYAYSARDEQGEPLRIVHRDVSPHNVLVSVAGDVKLIDFGVAKSANQRHVTMDATLKGKLAYLSPEQARGEPLDGRSDLFGLGIVLYEMLAARHPFIRSEPLLTLNAIEHAEWTRLARSSPELAPADAVLEKLLARSPEDRFPTGAAASEALAALRSAFPAPPMRLGPFVASLFGKELDELDQPHSTGEATLTSRRPLGATEVFGATPRTPAPGATEVFGAVRTPVPGATEVFGKPATPAPGATQTSASRPAAPVSEAPAHAGPAAASAADASPEVLALRRAKRRSAGIAGAILLGIAGVGIGAVALLSGPGATESAQAGPPIPPPEPPGAPPEPTPAAAPVAAAPSPAPAAAPETSKPTPATEPKVAKPAPTKEPKVENPAPAREARPAKTAPAKEPKVVKAAPAKEPKAGKPAATEAARPALFEVSVAHGEKARSSTVRQLPASVVLVEAPTSVRLVFAAGRPPTLHCDPWQIVSVDGVSIGRSPVELANLSGEPKVIELRRPNMAGLELRLSVRPGRNP